MRFKIHMHKRLGWRPWFAWYPIRVDNIIVWLETVERKMLYTAYDKTVVYALLPKH